MDSVDSSPEKEGLRFEFSEDGLEPDMVEVMRKIKELAEKQLYHWKTFPVIPPKSITSNVMVQPSEGGDTTAGTLGLEDLFIAATFDELDEVARDNSGELKKLTDAQLETVWQNGEFDVPSGRFPGQHHRWRLSLLLQKGSVRAHNSLLDDTALAVRLIIITAYNRVYSGFFSLSQSVRGWARGLWQILDILFGMPSTTYGYLANKIRGEHMRHLVAELDIKQSLKKYLSTFCEYVKDKCILLKSDKVKTSELRPPPLPYTYQTPKGQEINLKLFNKDLMDKCLPLLHGILERDSKGWYVQFTQKLVHSLKNEGLNKEEISQKVKEGVMEEYLNRVFASIMNSTEIEDLHPGLGVLLVDQAKSTLAIDKARMHVEAKLLEEKQELVTRLKETYPVRSRIKAWMNDRLFKFEKQFASINMWMAHEESINNCEDQQLHQSLYFLKRDLNFIKEREPIIEKELAKVKKPNREFSFGMRIWLPKNWIVRKEVLGKSERIPTVILDAMPPTDNTRKKTATYLLDRYRVLKTSTRYPFWRWWNYVYRTWTWMWNSIFWLLIVVPWYSSVSLRALFGSQPFIADLWISQVDGSLYPDETNINETLASRLRLLWANVWESRLAFEEAPDSSFLGKSLTRHINRFWNFVLKGALGSVALVVVFPPLCIVTSLLSITAAITTPIWVPVITLMVQAFFFLIYDLDAPNDADNQISILLEALLYRIALQGCIQPVAAVLVGAVFCPISSVSILIYGSLKRGLRALWDTFMFYAIIRKRGRIPAHDSFVAKRIFGPGLASNYFYQIKPEQALAALEGRLELDELVAWEATQKGIIRRPVAHFSNFVSKCFSPFSANLVIQGVYKQLHDETEKYISKLVSKVDQRKRPLQIGLSLDLRNKIKLPERQLKIAILLAADLLEKFYPQHVLSRLATSEDDFWESHGLENNDWKGLACFMLSEIFSPSFLVPLEKTDNQFELKVNHLNLSRYVDMLKTAEFRDDLDSVTEIYTTKDEVKGGPPDLDTSYFNPVKEAGEYYGAKALRERRRLPWKRDRQEVSYKKLENPLPIPHPANIAILIYNREHDQDPIDAEDTYCQRILRAAKEVAYIDIGDVVDSADVEASTPDNGPSESENPTSYLAEQEHSFSDSEQTTPLEPSLSLDQRDDSLHQICEISEKDTIEQSAARLASQSEKTDEAGDIGNVKIDIRDGLDDTENAAMLSLDEDSENSLSPSGTIIYLEEAGDNSCVVDLKDYYEDSVDI